jgi:hypothetical protein
MKIITCYLDSQDYSTLTDPKTLTIDRKKLREELVEFAIEGKVQFLFSATSISENVAISPDAVHLAELKAEFLVELCGTNALISFDRLIQKELEDLLERKKSQHNMIDPCGNWFPDITNINADKSPLLEICQRAENDLNDMKLPREQRRAALRKIKKNSKPNSQLESFLAKQNSKLLAEEFIKLYPMKLEHADIIAKYGIGRATEVEFNNALIDSLRDPRWMMKWFAVNQELSNPVADMVRKPGRELGELMRKFISVSSQHASFLKKHSLDLDPTGKRGEIYLRWQETQDRQLVELMRRVAIGQNILWTHTSPLDIDEHCPGVSTMIRSLFSSVWENIGGSRKEVPSDSQPVDALHSLYAPYVTVFRADRFMSPHIQKQVDRHGTIIVSRLTQLPEILRAEIQKREKCVPCSS